MRHCFTTYRSHTHQHVRYYLNHNKKHNWQSHDLSPVYYLHFSPGSTVNPRVQHPPTNCDHPTNQSATRSNHANQWWRSINTRAFHACLGTWWHSASSRRWRQLVHAVDRRHLCRCWNRAAGSPARRLCDHSGVVHVGSGGSGARARQSLAAFN